MRTQLRRACLAAAGLLALAAVLAPPALAQVTIEASDALPVEGPTAALPSGEIDIQVPPSPVPGGYYSFDFETFAYSAFERISLKTGEATHIWSIDLQPDPRPWVMGPMPLGLAFDLDGAMYTTLNILSYDPNEVQSQFARVDTKTGQVTLIGEPFNMNTAGGDIDACGNYFATGFQVDHLGYVWGDGCLYRFDKYTGERTRVGCTGMTDWMDLAFDSTGTLWATTQNKLFTISTTTGERTFVSDIAPVPDAGDPHYMEVMSIAFDDRDVLYATAMTTFYDDPRGAPVMRIEPQTGVATLLGYTHQYYNHGGDIMPTTVKVAHRKPQGDFMCLTIRMNDLKAHLAHGDYVPGTGGHTCACP